MVLMTASTSCPLRALRGETKTKTKNNAPGEAVQQYAFVSDFWYIVVCRADRPRGACTPYRQSGSASALTFRMQRVEDYMNSNEFAARDGGGLGSLAACLHERCSRVSALQGERLRS